MRRVTHGFAWNHMQFVSICIYPAGVAQVICKPHLITRMSCPLQNEKPVPVTWTRDKWKIWKVTIQQSKLWRRKVSDERHRATIYWVFLKVVCWLLYMCLQEYFKVGTIVVPFLQMRRLRLCRAKQVFTAMHLGRGRAGVWTQEGCLQSPRSVSLNCICFLICTSEDSAREAKPCAWSHTAR